MYSNNDGIHKTSTSNIATKCPLSEANTRKSEVLVPGTFNVEKFDIFQRDSRSNLPSERVKFEAGIFKEIFIDNETRGTLMGAPPFFSYKSLP